MKKLLFTAIIAMSAISVAAQNIQLHYDFGRNIYTVDEQGRQKLTATFELFHADRLGNWFYFIDMDFNRKGVIGSYMELSREFNLSKNSPFAAHIEYDGGINASGGVFQPAALAGVAYNGHNADFTGTYSVQLMYKQYFTGYSNRAFASYQLTSVWRLMFCHNKLTFSGFLDLWRDEKTNHNGQLAILTEPQLWYNITPHFSVGTEIELSNNFIFNANPESGRSFFVNPTLAIKCRL